MAECHCGEYVPSGFVATNWPPCEEKSSLRILSLHIEIADVDVDLRLLARSVNQPRLDRNSNK